MPPASSSTEFDKFLALAKSLIRKYQADGRGEFIVKLKRSSNDGTKEIFAASIPCAHVCSFSFIRTDWEKYRSRQCLPIADEPFDCLIRSVLKILEDTGHGEVNMDFHKGKKGHTLFTYRVTISYQNRLQPT